MSPLGGYLELRKNHSRFLACHRPSTLDSNPSSALPIPVCANPSTPNFFLSPAPIPDSNCPSLGLLYHIHESHGDTHMTCLWKTRIQSSHYYWPGMACILVGRPFGDRVHQLPCKSPVTGSPSSGYLQVPSSVLP